MLENYLTAAIAMCAISILWLGVQRSWRRHFPGDAAAGGDALAGRGGCRGCTCGGTECRESQQNSTTREAS